MDRVNGSEGKGLNKRLAGRLPGCRLGWVPGGWAGLAARRLGWVEAGLGWAGLGWAKLLKSGRGVQKAVIVG